MSDEKKKTVEVCGVDYEIPADEKKSNIQHRTSNVQRPMNENTAEFVEMFRRQMKDLEAQYFYNDNFISPSHSRRISLEDIFFVQQNVEAALLKITEMAKEIEELKLLNKCQVQRRSLEKVCEENASLKEQIDIYKKELNASQCRVFDLQLDDRRWKSLIKSSNEYIMKLEDALQKIIKRIDSVPNDNSLILIFILQEAEKALKKDGE